MRKEIERYENGIIKRVYIEDKGFAVCKIYNPKGQLLVYYTQKNNQYDGVYEEFFDDGRRKKRCYFKAGKLTGLYEEYNQKEELVIRRLYWKNEIMKSKRELIIRNVGYAFKVARHKCFDIARSLTKRIKGLHR